MALKGDRQVDAVEIGFFLNEAAVKGKVLVAPTAGGSGVALNAAQNIATVASTPSGQKPLGILLNEFVIVDQTKQYINEYKDQSISGDKATILTKGWVVTDQVVGNVHPGDKAVLFNNGTVSGITGELITWNRVANPQVGQFRSGEDQNGFARLYVDL